MIFKKGSLRNVMTVTRGSSSTLEEKVEEENSTL
jgi:hypothetical protein